MFMSKSSKSGSAADPLSEVLASLHVQVHVSARFEAGGDWSVRFPAQSHMKFGAALKGGFWLKLGKDAPRRIEEGDTYLMTDSPGYVMSSDPALRAVDGSALYARARGHRVHHGGNDTVVLGGSFLFDVRDAALLTAGLPRLIVIPRGTPAAAMIRTTLAWLDGELQHPRMGVSLIGSRLGDVLLVQALRALADAGMPTGWLGALGQPRIGAALRLMHGRVAHPWKVAELASAVGMSRSAFARKFHDHVGLSPLDYLIRWRMHLARQALRRGDTPVSAIAESLGYSSPSAFGNAFKRMFGSSPGHYRKLS